MFILVNFLRLYPTRCILRNSAITQRLSTSSKQNQKNPKRRIYPAHSTMHLPLLTIYLLQAAANPMSASLTHHTTLSSRLMKRDQSPCTSEQQELCCEGIGGKPYVRALVGSSPWHQLRCTQSTPLCLSPSLFVFTMSIFSPSLDNPISLTINIVQNPPVNPKIIYYPCRKTNRRYCCETYIVRQTTFSRTPPLPFSLPYPPAHTTPSLESQNPVLQKLKKKPNQFTKPHNDLARDATYTSQGEIVEWGAGKVCAEAKIRVPHPQAKNRVEPEQERTSSSPPHHEERVRDTTDRDGMQRVVPGHNGSFRGGEKTAPGLWKGWQDWLRGTEGGRV